MANISSLESIIEYDEIVLVYGHFSSFHHGHIRFLKASKEEGKTICLSTHNLKDVEEICTDFSFFKNCDFLLIHCYHKVI